MLSLCHELGLESTQGCAEILSQPREAQSQAAHGQSQEQPAKMSSFSFIVCSQETPLIPESGHLSELLQPLHRMGTLCLYQHSVKIPQENLESRSRSEEQRAASHPHIQKYFRENPASTKKLGAHCRAAEQLVHNLPVQKAQRALAAFGEGKQRVGRTQEQLRGCAALQGWGSGSAQTRGCEQDEQRDPSCKLWKTASGKQTVPICGV